jgi:hypothetical protein
VKKSLRKGGTQKTGNSPSAFLPVQKKASPPIFRFSRVPPRVEDQYLSKTFKNLLSDFQKITKAKEATGRPISNKA